MNHITDTDTTTFRYTVIADGKAVQKEITDGECTVVYIRPGGEAFDNTGMRWEPTYWQNGISYTFAGTNRMALSRPTVTVAIPVTMLGIDATTATTAAADFCLRRYAECFISVNEGFANKARPDSENGKFLLHEPGGEVLVRNTSYFAMRPDKDYQDLPGKRSGAMIQVTRFIDPPPDRLCLCIRMEIQLPIGKLNRAKKMLTMHLPECTEIFVAAFDREGLQAAVGLEETQNTIRAFLRTSAYCAFIANGSILPREKDSARPMQGALPFASPPEDEIEVAGIRGLGIKRGVTVVTGGGYSGKSTVLNAISAGIYNHHNGDGRELCLTDKSAVTITAEDGRAVSALNISPFVQWIPGGDTVAFSTARASGSTSQAANIMEAVECGASLLLIDEDRSATNFMIRDAAMKQLITREPLVPFTDRVRELAAQNVSTILVIGGSGEYLTVADCVYMMDDFVMNNATARAKAFTRETSEAPAKADWTIRRAMLADGFTSYPEGGTSERLEVSDTGFLIIGNERIDLRMLHNLATPAQTDALAFMLRHLMKSTDTADDVLTQLARSMRGLSRVDSGKTLDIPALIDTLYARITLEGLDVLDTGFFTAMNRFLDLPRPYELRAAINRMRHVAWNFHKI